MVQFEKLSGQKWNLKTLDTFENFPLWVIFGRKIEKFFFAFFDSEWLNSRKKAIKSEIWRPSKCFPCVRRPRLSHFQAENHQNVKYFKFLLVNRMMLYGYKTFRKSSEQGHKGPKKTKKLIFVILGHDKSHCFESFFGKMSDFEV